MARPGVRVRLRAMIDRSPRCGSWLSLGWFAGYEIPVACDHAPGHSGEHMGVREGRRFTWRVYYSRWIDGKAVKA
jgi:hypothetical protein